LVIIVTDFSGEESAIFTAKLRPAMPDPMTRISVFSKI